MSIKTLSCLLGVLLAGTAGTARAAPAEDLASYSLEDLLALESTSVARKRQRVADSAAAVTVITQDDIRRSGAVRLIDVLRLAPGVEVGEIDSNATAVTIRGFNTRFSNSLLVMVDGRSVYVSTLSGVFWDQQLVPLADIERIEIVRGPGATMWGSNAVNGVINIITRQSVDALGWSAEAVAGTQDRSATLRYGTQLSDQAALRSYVTLRDSDNLYAATAQRAGHSRAAQFGFRLDVAPSTEHSFTLQGDVQTGSFTAYTGEMAQMAAIALPSDFSGQNLLGRWTHTAQDDVDLTVQAYLDRVVRTEFGVGIERVLADVDSSVRWRAGDRHELVIGINARLLHDNLDAPPGGFFSFGGRNFSDRWFSGLIQDDIWLKTDRLRLSIGTKLEYNSVTGTELQPSARLLWKPASSTSVWAGFSRANRIPARFEESLALNLTLPPGAGVNQGSALPMQLRIIPDSPLRSVKLDAFEAGLRTRLWRDWSLDAAVYLNRYKSVLSYDLQSAGFVPFPTPAIAADFRFGNRATARSEGAEVTISGSILRNWRLRGTYSFLSLRTAAEPPGTSISTVEAGLSPRHQFSLRSEWDVSDALEADVWLRHVSALPTGAVPAYTDLDLRIAYRISPAVEATLLGNNLLRSRRLEFFQPDYPSVINFVPRSIAIGLMARF